MFAAPDSIPFHSATAYAKFHSKSCSLFASQATEVLGERRSWFDLIKQWVLPAAEPAVEAVGYCSTHEHDAQPLLHAVLVNQATPEVRRWARELNQAIAQDFTLSEGGQRRPRLLLEEGYLDCLGDSQNFWCPPGPPKRLGEAAPATAFMQQHLLAVLLASDQRTPVGYCTFSITSSSRDQNTEGQRADVSVDLAVEQLWLMPDYRFFGMSQLLVSVITLSTQRHLASLNQLSRRARFRCPQVRVQVCGQGSSRALQAFIARISEQLKEALAESEREYLLRQHRVPSMRVMGVEVDFADWRLQELPWAA